VTRIIAGFAGSLTLKVPSSGTRPTSDRVREAIFSALTARGALDDARVLDLYAGSGALGLEAASRGASAVTLVEKSPAAAQICRINAALVAGRAPRTTATGATGAEGRARATIATSAPTRPALPGAAGAASVITKPVQNFLASTREQPTREQPTREQTTPEQWDLVFIDPPYELAEAELSAVLTLLVPRLAADAVIVLERSSRTPVPVWPTGLTLDKVSRYGETVIYWLRPSEGL
jgi:16S rRNA (guanine966-N2)-methyltransferase